MEKKKRIWPYYLTYGRRTSLENPDEAFREDLRLLQPFPADAILWARDSMRQVHCGAPTKAEDFYMHFMLRKGWYCQFLEADLKTPLPRKLNLKTPDDIRGMIERVGKTMTTEESQGFEYAISMGRGSAWLMLSEEQYQKLRR